MDDQEVLQRLGEQFSKESADRMLKVEVGKLQAEVHHLEHELSVKVTELKQLQNKFNQVTTTDSKIELLMQDIHDHISIGIVKVEDDDIISYGKLKELSKKYM